MSTSFLCLFHLVNFLFRIQSPWFESTLVFVRVVVIGIVGHDCRRDEEQSLYSLRHHWTNQSSLVSSKRMSSKKKGLRKIITKSLNVTLRPIHDVLLCSLTSLHSSRVSTISWVQSPSEIIVENETVVICKSFQDSHVIDCWSHVSMSHDEGLLSCSLIIIHNDRPDKEWLAINLDLNILSCQLGLIKSH